MSYVHAANNDLFGFSKKLRMIVRPPINHIVQFSVIWNLQIEIITKYVKFHVNYNLADIWLFYKYDMI